MKEPMDTSTRPVTGNFSLTATLPQGKQMTISGYLYDGESFESVNEKVDLLSDVIERQRQRAEIPELELKREHLIRQFEAFKDHLVALEAKKRAGKKLTGQEQLALENIQNNIAKVQEDIEKGQIAIDEQKRKTGVT